MGNNCPSRFMMRSSVQDENIDDSQEVKMLENVKKRRMSNFAKAGNAEPYKDRQSLIKALTNNVQKGKTKEAIITVTELRQSFGIDIESITGSRGSRFQIDETGETLVMNMTRLLNLKPRNYQREFSHNCNQLLQHVSPPAQKRSMIKINKGEDLKVTELRLAGVSLKKTKNHQSFKTALENCENLESIDISYSGICAGELDRYLNKLKKLPKLKNLILRGNCLTQEAVDHITDMMCEDAENFPSLMWIDFRNNVDIFSVQERFLEQLKKRWPKKGLRPEFRDLAEGRQLILEEIEHGI